MASNADTSSGSSSRSIRIYFVCRETTKPEDPCNALLATAFKALVETGIRPKWTDEKYCRSLTTRVRNDVFVLPDFDCSGFDHLRALRCSIVGPAFLLSCVQQDRSLPKTHQPLLSDCMSGVVACFTSILKLEREKIRDMILCMNGRVEAGLSTECTVLITREVGSHKYKAAVRQGNIPIITPDWIDAAWERSRSEVFNVKDHPEMLTRYKCSIFAGLVITVSNIRSDQRKQIEQLIIRNGGTFSGEMKQAETTHLVTDTTDSEKFRATKKWIGWSVQVVTTAWVHDSIARGFCMDENDYLTEKKCVDDGSNRTAIAGGKRKQKCSTPTVSGATTSAVPSFFADPNSTALTAIMPEAPNVTVMSNVSLRASTSYINGTDVTNVPASVVSAASIFNHDRSGLSKTADVTVKIPAAFSGPAAAVASTSTITAPEDTPRSPSPSPQKRMRSVNKTAPAPSENLQRPEQASKSSARRPTTSSSVNSDVMSQYIDEGVVDSNRSFCPNFEVNDALEYVAKEGVGKKPAPEESPSVIIEKQLTTAAEATAAGACYYNSPAVTGANDLRASLTKRLELEFGVTKFRRHGSNKFNPNASTSTVDSPVTLAPVATSSKDTPLRRRPSLLSQDTQEENVVIDWDDPNQRRERQRVGGLLKKRNEPTQSFLDDAHGNGDVVQAQVPEVEIVPSQSPEPPQKPSYNFQLTSVVKEDRDRYMEVIRKLGGTVCDSPNYDPICTHLVAGSFTRNEKLLSAIASGTWVLFTSYLDACDAAGSFVEETPHEYGNLSVKKKIPSLREELAGLTKACSYWRQKVQKGDSAKAYHGWNAFLVVENGKEDGFARILRAGGGSVTVAKNVHEVKEGSVTHVIVDPTKKLSPVVAAAVNRCQASGAKCYKSDVIFGYLAGESLDGYLCKPPV